MAMLAVATTLCICVRRRVKAAAKRTAKRMLAVEITGVGLRPDAGVRTDMAEESQRGANRQHMGTAAHRSEVV